MNLFELFDKAPQKRNYYQTKKPIAVILTLLGMFSLVLCTPAGAAYLESWIKEQESISFAAPALSWIIAISFDLTFAYLIAQFFNGLFTGVNGKKNYWDIPTILLLVLFGGATLAWSFWGSDIRKAVASQQIAQKQSATIDSAFHAVAAISAPSQALTSTRKGLTRQERKNNEAIAAAIAAQSEQTKILGNMADQKLKVSQSAEIHRHKIIENGKLIILGAYLFLLITIGCVEYIKSRKTSTSPISKQQATEEKDNIRDISQKLSDNEKKKRLIRQAKDLRNEGMSLRAIGKELDTSHTNVSKLLKLEA